MHGLASRTGACCALMLAVAAGGAARAQNTGNMATPIVNAGEKSIEYRVAYSFAEDGMPSSFAHRLHYQQSLDDSWRLRAVIAATDRDGEPFDLRFVQIEALYQFVESRDAGWDSGITAQLAVPTSDGRPGRFRIGWSANADLTDRWQARGVVFTGRELGANSRDGLLLELRGEATYKLSNGVRVGPQFFSNFNTTAHFGSFNEQKHQLGFIVKGEIAKGLTCNAGALFGLSRAASGTDLRFFLAYGF